MARPIKNNADYFPHDADMRNDPRVKALRRKFGIEGYGVYCMVVEYLTDAEHFTARVDNLGLELMAGDFDLDSAKLMEVIQYCLTVDLFQMDNLILRCKSLENRLNPLLSKRENDRGRVIVNNRSENQDSKVKKSKVNERKEEESIEKTAIMVFGESSENFFVIPSKYAGEKAIRINGVEGLKEFYSSNMSQLHEPIQAEKFLAEKKGSHFNDFMHLHNTYGKFLKDGGSVNGFKKLIDLKNI